MRLGAGKERMARDMQEACRLWSWQVLKERGVLERRDSPENEGL